MKRSEERFHFPWPSCTPSSVFGIGVKDETGMVRLVGNHTNTEHDTEGKGIAQFARQGMTG
jgi:hypothetical protein